MKQVHTWKKNVVMEQKQRSRRNSFYSNDDSTPKSAASGVLKFIQAEQPFKRRGSVTANSRQRSGSVSIKFNQPNQDQTIKASRFKQQAENQKKNFGSFVSKQQYLTTEQQKENQIEKQNSFLRLAVTQLTKTKMFGFPRGYFKYQHLMQYAIFASFQELNIKESL